MTIIGQYNFDTQTGTIKNFDITDVVAGISDPTIGTPYVGTIKLNGLTRGSIQWRFGGSSPINSGSYIIIGELPYMFDVREIDNPVPGGRSHEFIDKLPLT